MNGQFAQQLANLQRAASRNRDGDGGGGGVGDRNTGGRSGGGGDFRRGEYGRREGRDGGSSYHNRDSNSRNYHDNDRHNNRRWEGSREGGRDYNSRKRDRNEYGDDGNRGSRDYRGGGMGRGGGGRGRFGGSRENYRHDDRHRRGDGERDDRGDRGDRGDDVPLAELVGKVAEKYEATKISKDNEDGSATLADKGDPTKAKKPRRHIALLFLTIKDLPHEHVWKEWIKSGCGEDGSDDDDGALVSVICHAKYPEQIRSTWLRRRHLLLRRRDVDIDRNGNDDAKGSNNIAVANNAADGFDERNLKFHSRCPEWGSIEIARAMIDLLEEGLRIGGGSDGVKGGQGRFYRRYLSAPEGEDATDAAVADITPPVGRFIFVSESCLPVATLRETELALFGPRTAPDSKASLYDKSWVNARSSPNNGYARQLQWDAIKSHDVPQSHVWKADQWLALNRRHADAVASLPRTYLGGRQLWPAFRRCRASDEMYFPTALATLGILRRTPSKGGGEVEVDDAATESGAGGGIRRRRITYCDWSVGAKNPASFTSSEWRDIVKKARGEGCLFARKFVPASKLPTVRDVGRKRRAGDAEDGDDGIVSAKDWRAAVVERG